MSSVDRPRVFRLIGAYGTFVVLTAVLIAAAVAASFGLGLVVALNRGDGLVRASPLEVGLFGSVGCMALFIYLGLRTRSASIVVEEGRITYYKKPGLPRISRSLADATLKTYQLGHTLSYEVLFDDGERIRFGGDIPKAQALVHLVEKESGKSF